MSEGNKRELYFRTNSMNELSGAEAVVRMLQGHGVSHIFGLCGDTSLPLYDALQRLDHGMTHILTRDERSAGYMADAYARVTGKVGVCEGPSGGGATYILPALVEANESSIPILAITTDISVSSRGHYALTELDQKALFAPVTKWNAVVDRAEEAVDIFRTAFRQMTTGRPGAAHIGLPFDVQRAPVSGPAADLWCDPEHGSYPAYRSGPARRDVDRVADVLASAENPVFVVGGGVVIADAMSELQGLAERLDAPVATTISGQGSIAETHPLAVGVVGSNGGTPETRAIVEAADMVIFVGCRAGSVTTERWRYPAPGECRIVHIDSDPGVIGASYPTEAALVGDAKSALGALDASLAAILQETPSRAVDREMVARQKDLKRAAFAALAASDETPIRPERVIATLQDALPSDAILVCDPGTPCPYVSAFYEIRETGRHFISNRAHGALGYSLPASIGAHIGRPDTKTVALMGDGSFGFCAGELETMTRFNIPVTMVVFSNAVYGWIKAGQKTGYDGRYYSVDFGRTDHAAVAEAYGVKSWTVTDPADLKSALAAAIEHDGPTMVDVISQPLQEAKAPVSEWVA